MFLKYHHNAIAVLSLTAVTVLITDAYYPGHITYDGIWQLSQARAHQYNDWHPPLLTFLWGLIDRVWPGSGALLILDQGFLSSGIFLALRRYYAPIASASITIFMILSPPLLGVSGMIAKDALLLCCFALFIGLLLTAENALLPSRARIPLFLAAGLLLLLIQFSRYNSLPLTGFAGYALARVIVASFRSAAGAHRRAITLPLMLTCLAVFSVQTMIVPVVNRFVFEAKQMFPYQHIMIYDLAAISVDADVLLFDDHIFPSQDLQKLKRYFSRDTVVSIIDGMEKVQESVNPDDIESLRHRWASAIVRYPWHYVGERARLFAQLIGLPGYWVCAPFFETVDPNTLGLKIANKTLNLNLVYYLNYFRNSGVNRAWIYAFVNIMAIIVLLRAPRTDSDHTLAIVATASLLYVASYYFVAPSCEFRYAAPIVLTGMLLAAVLARRLWPAQPGSTPQVEQEPAGHHRAPLTPL